MWHSGINLNLEQYLHYLDPFVSSDLCAREMKITIDADSSGQQIKMLSMNGFVACMCVFHREILRLFWYFYDMCSDL